MEDGTLTVKKSDGSETGNDIVYEMPVGPAFEYAFEFKFSEGGNSGVKYFVDKKYSPGGKSGVGLEFQVLDDQKHPDAKMGRDGNRTLGQIQQALGLDWFAFKARFDKVWRAANGLNLMVLRAGP